MKYLAILSVVFVPSLFNPSFAHSDDATEASPIQVEIEEEATELGDLNHVKASTPDEEEVQALPANQEAPVKVAAKAMVKKTHAYYLSQIAKLKKEIGSLKAAIDRTAEEDTAAEIAAQDMIALDKLRKTRDTLKKQARGAVKARRVHVAYEDPFN